MSIDTERPQDSSQPPQGTAGDAHAMKNSLQKRARLRRPRPAHILLAVLLICIVGVVGGDVQRNLFRAAPQITPTSIPAAGPYVQLPLSGSQVSSLQNLAAHMSDQQLAQMYVSRMTLDQKLAQLFIVQYYGTSYSSDLEYMVHNMDVGGVIVYAAQMNTLQQSKDDITRMQQHAWMPLFIAADEEGGFVERVQNVYGHLPGALETYQTGKVSNAVALANTISKQLHGLGINTDLAPDVDVPVVMGPDQYLRTWGYTPASVIKYGGAYLQTIQGDGLVACIKHFPGLGAATTDAHTGLPVVKRTKDQIYSTELAPFNYFIHTSNKLENPGMIMTTDVLMPAIDPTWPAELSHTFVTDILRKQLGYNGVIITDALYMDGISKKWDLAQAAVLALQAGNDMLLGANGSYQLGFMINGIKQAISDGRLSMQQINASVTRVIALKIHNHLLPATPPQW